jgi:predicted transposase/invertase (TIGR01784 family)
VIVGIDPKVDYAFKRLLGRPESIPLLIHLLQAVLQLPAGHQILSLDLLNPFNEKDFETDKLSILDIKVRDQAGRLYNVEMQLLVLGSFRARVLYYWSKLYADQLQEGVGYEALRPTVSIIFVNARLFPKSTPWHSVFELREQESGMVFSDHLQVHILEIPKFELKPEELEMPLERWMYFLKHEAELDPDQLPPPRCARRKWSVPWR